MFSTTRFGVLFRNLRSSCYFEWFYLQKQYKFRKVESESLLSSSLALCYREFNGHSIMPPKKKGTTKAATPSKKDEMKSKKAKEPSPAEMENDQDSTEETGAETPSKPVEKKPRGRSARNKEKKPQKVVEETPAKADSEQESDEENGDVGETSKTPRGKAAKEKAAKGKKGKENGKSNDDVPVEDDKAKGKRGRGNAKKKPVSDDEKDEEEEVEEPVKKKAKLETKQPMNKTESNLEEINFACDKVNEDGEKFNLKIACWNVSGIRALIKKNGLEYFAKEDPDIIALQEIKCDTNKLPNEVKIAGYERYFLDSERPGYCGVALYSKVKPIEVKYGIKNASSNNEGRIITAEYEDYYVVNVYVPNAGQKLVTMPKRMEWNEDFKKYMKELDAKKPVIICGDMNVAHQEIDLKNPKTNTKNAGFTKEERDGMTDFLEQGFVDTFRKLYPDQINAYTFWAYFNNARAKGIGWRLDYFLVSERVAKKVCDNVIRDKVYGSDHCPIVLYITM